MPPPSSQQEESSSVGGEPSEAPSTIMESVPVDEEPPKEEGGDDEREEEKVGNVEKTQEEEDEIVLSAKEEQDQDNTAEEEPKMEVLNNEPPNSNNTNNDYEPQDTLEHKLQPGDHVIRWEMTVIAWPIQIHGIVLEVGKQYVELADFGLTANADSKQEEVGENVTVLPQQQRQQDQPHQDADELAQSQQGEDVSHNSACSGGSNNLTPTGSRSGSQHGNSNSNSNSNSIMDDNSSTTSQTRFQVHQQAPLVDHPMAQKMEDAVSSAWNKLRKDKKRPKQRITVHIITTQKDLNKWHKVNYGGKLFGLGGDEEGQEEDDDAGSGGGAPKKTSLADKFKNSLKFGKPRNNNATGDATATATATANEPGEVSPTREQHFPRIRAATAKLKNNPHVKHANEKTMQGFQKTGSATLQGLKNVNSAISSFWTSPKKTHKTAASKADQVHSSSAYLEEDGGKEYTTDDADASEEESNQLDDKQEDKDNSSSSDGFSQRRMNPAMAKLMAEQQKAKEREQTAADQKQKQKQQSEKETATATKPKHKLPKSDPPKLVLARAYFLLKHGESVLPPYHAFHSNSECIAVFCKTGVWSTLQAAVFLHSTAIGNAKSTMAVTLGVAASVPVLAPVIGMAGLAMVGAPWLILKESKGKWEEATMKLTDLFWQQAEPEVFVECIEHWSGLVEKGEKKTNTEAVTTTTTTTTTTTEQQQEHPLEEEKPQIMVEEEEEGEKAAKLESNDNGCTEAKEGSGGKDQDSRSEEGETAATNKDATAAATEDEPAKFRLASV